MSPPRKKKGLAVVEVVELGEPSCSWTFIPPPTSPPAPSTLLLPSLSACFWFDDEEEEEDLSSTVDMPPSLVSE